MVIRSFIDPARRRAGLLATLVASAVLVACGGGGGSSGATLADGGGAGGSGNTQSTSTPVISEGVMAKGSVIVNGVRYDDSSAEVRIDNAAATAARLQNGMVVRLQGSTDDNGGGTAFKVRAGAEVRGTVQSKDATAVPPAFTVLGQRVTVDDTTVFANLAGATLADRIAALAVGSSMVEVHGQRDAAGRIRASRVELQGPGASDHQLRGTIGALSPTSFVVNGLVVGYSAATISPAGATLANGMLVEVHGNPGGPGLIATRVHPEDAQDDSFRLSGSGNKWEVEGFVSGFSTHPGTFIVAGRTVQTNASTRFENGAAGDLADGIKVEAEGRLEGSTIVAVKVSFRSTRAILAGVATVNVAGRTLTVLGRTVRVDDHTDVRPRAGSGLAGIPTGARVEVRGVLSSDGSALMAERVEDIGSSGGAREIVQARVTAKVQSPPSITLFGITANLNGASQYQDAAGNAVSQAAFLAAITAQSAGGTLVKVKGAMPPGTSAMSVEEAQIED